MCTIGVRRFGDDEYVLFKNKDFARNHFEDRLVVERGLFGVVGLSTWSQTDPRLDRYSGVSVGANDAGLLCCDANVRGAEDQSNYDELVEMALRSGGGVGEGVAAIRAAVSTRPYLWSNLIMIDHYGAAAVEVRDRTIVVTASFGRRLGGRRMSSREHWETVYRDRVPESLTWYQAEPALSLSLIAASNVEFDAAVADIGGGSSRLVDHLLEKGYTNVTVLDVSAIALRYARDRLADRADEVTFIEGDVLEHRFDSTIGFWHDRAVFHFLTEPADQTRYMERLNATIAADGHVIIATFGLDGPERCSGLRVQRYGPETLSQALGTSFEPMGFHTETHITPTGATQEFLYGHFRRVGSPPS